MCLVNKGQDEVASSGTWTGCEAPDSRLTFRFQSSLHRMKDCPLFDSWGCDMPCMPVTVHSFSEPSWHLLMDKCSPICNCRMPGQCICHSSRPKLKWAFLLGVSPLTIISPLAWCSIVAETSWPSPPQCLFNQNTCKKFPLDLRKPSRCQDRFSSPYLYFFLLSIYWGFCITSHQRAVSQATPCFSSFPGAQGPCFHGFCFQLDNLTSDVSQL